MDVWTFFFPNSATKMWSFCLSFLSSNLSGRSKHSATYSWEFSENSSISGKPTFIAAMLAIHFLSHEYDQWIWIEMYFLLPLCYNSSIVNRNVFYFTIWSYFKCSEMSSFLFRFKISNNEDIIVFLKSEAHPIAVLWKWS